MNCPFTSLTFAFSFLCLAAAQGAVIKGKVIDAETGKSLYGAIVRVDGKQIGAVTEFDGSFEFKYASDEPFVVVASMVSYKPWTKEVTPNEKEVVLNVRLESNLVMMNTVTVTTKRLTHTESAVLMEMKKLNSIASAVSAQQISKSQDRDAAEVARRIPGVTVIENRFVMVRGLTERYNAVLLNNVIAPSVEADAKAFSFDLVPSNMIDRFIIYKSPSPDLPGEFAGGVIKIHTRNIPDNNQLAVTYTSGIRTGTTFQNFALNPGSPTDWLGFDNGYRDLPADFPANLRDLDPDDKVTLSRIGQSLQNTWTYTMMHARPDHRAGINFARRFKFGRFQLGNITSISYSITNSHYTSNRLDYNSFDSATQTSDTIFHYVDDVYSSRARIGVMHNWSLSTSENNIFEFKNLLNQAGDNETILREGFNYEAGQERREYSFRYTERMIYSGQLSGIHKTSDDGNNLDWTLGYSTAYRNEPDWRRVRHSRPLDDTLQPFAMYVHTSANPFFLGRLYFNVNESNKLGSVNYERVLSPEQKSRVPKVKVGGYYENRDKQFSVRNLGYAVSNIFNFDWDIIALPLDSVFAPENIDTLRGLKIDEDTKPSDSYLASSRLAAGYGMLTLPIKRFTVVAGARMENHLQTLNSNQYNGDTVIVNNNVMSVLPSVNVSYHFGERMLIRAAYGRTVNRPEFRELAPLYFYDFVFNAIYTGEDSLLTPTIDNFDLRWELYKRPGEVISVAAFYKRFVNPIEMYFVPGVGSLGTRTFSFDNAPEAVSIGTEVEIRKSFKDVIKGINFLDGFSVLLNASMIRSNIILSDDSAFAMQRQRPMMGQSPYIVNAGVYYQNDSIRIQASLLYNLIGPRVVIVGIPGIPEVYEMPSGNLDLSISKGFGKHMDVRFVAQNILNRAFVLLQDANEDGVLDKETDQMMQHYQRGTYYTLGVALKI